MKVGADNKKKLAGAIVLMAIAVFLLVRMISTSGPKTGEEPQPGNSATGKAAPDRQASFRDEKTRHVAVVLSPTLDPRLRLDLLKDSEGLKYEGTGRNIFREHMDDIPKPVASGLKKPAPPPMPVGPPPPPPINLKFYGWASRPGEARAIFLARGDDVFVAHEGDIIARRYKVVRITPNAVQIQDVLSNNTQSIPLQG